MQANVLQQTAIQFALWMLLLKQHPEVPAHHMWVGFYVVAKHWFEKDGGVAGGCSRTPGKHTVVFCVVAKHWFEKRGGVLCGCETLV